jgi:predicted AAA+ superfamily ATPase
MQSIVAIKRPLWNARIRESWTKAPIVWLCGARRSGKTTLTHDLPAESVHYVNCALPVSAQMLRDPELFYRECRREIVVFDESHQLEDPSRVLKIGADAFPKLKILATGSSTLAATRKFRDTLTGRIENRPPDPRRFRRARRLRRSHLKEAPPSRRTSPTPARRDVGPQLLP